VRQCSVSAKAQLCNLSTPYTCGTTVFLQVLAKEIIHSRKAISRLYVDKAHMISIGNALTEQLGEMFYWALTDIYHLPW